MKFKDRKEQRQVTETMVSILGPLAEHLDEEAKRAVEITIRILEDTEYETKH